MSQKPPLIDPVHFFDERGHHVSTYDADQARIAALEAENQRLKDQLKRVNALIAKSRVANASAAPPRLH